MLRQIGLIMLVMLPIWIAGSRALESRLHLPSRLDILPPGSPTDSAWPVLFILVLSLAFVAYRFAVAVRARRQAEQALKGYAARLEATVRELEDARDRAERAAHFKGAFLATMSHEIRTPMSGIIGFTDLLNETPLTDEQRQFVEIIRNSGDTLLALINDILELSKLESGRIELEERPFAISDVVEKALDLIAPRAAEKPLELFYVIAPDVPPTIQGDETRILQILANLLSNAVKFTDTGEVGVTVSAERTTDGVLLHLAVRDTGIGIAPDEQERIFEAFTQGNASTTRQYGGTGLGLAICLRLAEHMGGRLWLESEVAAGSTFHVTAATRSVVQTPPSEEEDGAAPLAGQPVLLLIPNAGLRRALGALVESWGLQPYATPGGHEAVAWVEAGLRPAAFVVDTGAADVASFAQHLADATDGAVPCVFLYPFGRQPRINLRAPVTYVAKPVKRMHLLRALTGPHATYPDAAEARVPRDVPALTHPPFSALRILVAEDNTANRHLILRMLAQLGYRADAVENGIKALDALERQPYDVVLLDIQMPEMDGVEVARHVETDFPKERQPALIAVTAHVMAGDRERYLAAGMHGFLPKPLRQDALARTLSELESVRPRRSR